MRRLVATVALLAALAGCTDSSEEDDGGLKADRRQPTSSVTAPASYDDALSTPVEDSVYPDVGDPGVDALHYDLDLSWSPDERMLSGHEELVFRATADADHVQLDFGTALDATDVTLDGKKVETTHRDKDLAVQAPVVADSEHTLALDYSGTPTPVALPSTRKDSPQAGLQVADDGGLWTMQEPYGAFTWYAVNDQPSDKALYDIDVDAPEGMIGIANGTLVGRDSDGGRTETSWHLDDPAAAYLVTLAVGDYVSTTDTSASGVEISYWTAPDETETLDALREAPQLLDWLETRLGPYPFDSLGLVVVPGRSGMETQTMITLGNDPSDSDPEVLVHEMAHQWYGDLVTPADWRDLWMNEGMASYLQGVWQDEAWLLPNGDSLAGWRDTERRSRAEAGPPGDYDPGHFAESNVYYGPALMWQRLRRKVGDDVFWKLVRDWPAARAGRSVTRADYLGWIEQQTGLELSAFFRRWLMSPTTPR